MEENSFEENERMIRRKLDREQFKIIMVMEKKEDHGGLSPIRDTGSNMGNSGGRLG